MMDFSVLLANLRAVAEKYKGQTTDPQTASAAYVDMFVQMLMKAEKMTDKYEDHITMMWVAVNQLASIYKDLSPGNSRDRLTQYIFGMCGRVVLNVQWAQLDDDDKVKKDFVSTVQTVHEHLKSLGYEKFQLILNLMESQWTDPILSEIMTSEDEEIEGGVQYIVNEDPEILKLRIEIMVKENCEEFALNLCEWSLKHPKLTGDLKIREYQIVILYKQQEFKKMQEVCSQVVCHDGILLMSRLAKASTNQDLCIRLAQVFLIQDWVNPDRNCCTQELLKLWIHHQYLADKDEERFLDSIWTVAKVCRSTEQIWVLIEGVRRECGDMFIQLYTELCKYALNIDKGNMEQEESKGNKEEVEKRKKLIARTCVRMAFMLKDYDFRMSRVCGLTAFSLLPTTDNLNLVNKLYWTIKNTSVTSGNSKINPATIYEVERLLGLMRPEMLNPDFSWKQIIPVCKRYQITKGSNGDRNDPKAQPKRSHDKPNILSSVKQSKTLTSAIPQTQNQLHKSQIGDSPKSIQRTHAEHLLAQNKNLSNEKVSQLAKEKFPKKDGDLVEGPPLNAKELGKTIKDLKKSIDLNNRYSADLSKKLSPLVTQNSVDSSSNSTNESFKEFQIGQVHMGSSSVTHSNSSHMEKSVHSSKPLVKSNKPTNRDSKNSVQIKGSFNVLRPPGTANQECAKIAQQIAEMHEKQRREKASLHGKIDGLKFALNSRNIPSSSQISDLLSLTIKEKLDSTQTVNSARKGVMGEGYSHELKQEKKQPNVIVPTSVPSSNQQVLTQNRQTNQLNAQKYYVASEEVMRNFRHVESGNITVGESKVPIKPIFSMAVRKSFNSHENQEELKQTISNLVKRTKNMPSKISMPSTADTSTLTQNDKVSHGKGSTVYQNTPSVLNSAGTSNIGMKVSACNLQTKPHHMITSVANTPSNVLSAVSQVSLIQSNQSNSNPDLVMAVVSDVNYQNYNTLSQNTLPVLSVQSVNQSLNFEQQSSSFSPQYQQYVHNPLEISQGSQPFLTQQPFATVQQLNNHLSQPLYETKSQIPTGHEFVPTQSNIIEQQNLHGNIQIQSVPHTPVVSQTFLQVQASPNATAIPQQVLNLSGQNMSSALNNSTQKSKVINTNINEGTKNNVERQGSHQVVETTSGLKSPTRHFIAPPELSPAVFRQLLSSFTQGSSSKGKGKQLPKQSKGQNQQTKTERIQQNLTREVIRHLTLNKNDETVKKSVIEATQKILQLRKQFDNANQSVPGQEVLQDSIAGAGITEVTNQVNNSVPCESIPELPDLGSELDSILRLDDNDQTNSANSTIPENSFKERDNGVIKVQSDAEMIQQLEKILDTSDNVTPKMNLGKDTNRGDRIPKSNDTNKKYQQKHTNSTYLNANRLAKEKEMRQTKDIQIEGSKTRIMCKNCEHFFRDAEQLSQHLNLNLCRKFNEYRERPHSAVKKNEKMDSVDPHNFPCSICAVSFKTMDDLKSHIKQTCSGSGRIGDVTSKDFEYSLVYKCGSCNWMHSNEKIAWKHVEKCTYNVTSSPSKYPAKISVLFKCKMCSEIFSDKETTYKHVSKLCPNLNGGKEQQNQNTKISRLSNDLNSKASASIGNKSFYEVDDKSQKTKCEDKKMNSSKTQGSKQVMKSETKVNSPLQNLCVVKTEQCETLDEGKSKESKTEVKIMSERDKKSSIEMEGLTHPENSGSLFSKKESSFERSQSLNCEVSNGHTTECKDTVTNDMFSSTKEKNVEKDSRTKDQEEIINQKLKRMSENFYMEQFTEIELKRKALKKLKTDTDKHGSNEVNKDSIKERKTDIDKHGNNEMNKDSIKERKTDTGKHGNNEVNKDSKKEIKKEADLNVSHSKEETDTKSDGKGRQEQTFHQNSKQSSKKRKAEDDVRINSPDMRNRINNFKRRRRGEVIDTRRDKGLRAKQLIKQKKYLIDEMEPIAPEVKKVNEKKEEESNKKQSRKEVLSEQRGLVKACQLCSFKHRNYCLAKHYVEKHNVGFRQTGQIVKCNFCRFKLVKEDLINLKKHVASCHWQEMLNQFGEEETEHSFNGKNKLGLRKPSPSKSVQEGETQLVQASPRKSEKLKKHLKALALRKKCAENLRKIAKKQSVGSEIEPGTLGNSESEPKEMDCSSAKNLPNEKNAQQSVDRMTVKRVGNSNDMEVHNTEIFARISGRTRSRSSSQSSRSSLNTQALSKANFQSTSGILPSSRTMTDSSNVTESSTLEEDGGLSDEKHNRSREKRRVSRRNSRCSDRKIPNEEHYSSDSSNDRSFSRFTRSTSSQSLPQKKNIRDKARKNGSSSSSGKLQTKSGTQRKTESGALSDDDEITSSTDVSEKFFIATKLEEFENSFEKGLSPLDFVSSKYSSDEEDDSDNQITERQYSLRKRKQKSNYRELECSDIDNSAKTSDSERSSHVNSKTEVTESGDESDLSQRKTLPIRRIKQTCIQKSTKKSQEKNLTIKRYRELKQREDHKQESDECENLTTKYVREMNQQSMSVLIGPDDELEDLKFLPQTTDTTVSSSSQAKSSENETNQEKESQHLVPPTNTTVLESDDEFAFLQQMDQKIESTGKDKSNKDNAKMEAFNSEFQKFTSRTNNTPDHDSSESDVDQSDVRNQIVSKIPANQEHVSAVKVENTQIFDVPVLPPRNNFVDAFHKFANNESSIKEKACVKEKSSEVKCRNFIGAFESFNEEKSVSVCLTRLVQRPKAKNKKTDWKQRFGIIDCSVRLEKLKKQTIEKYKTKAKEITPKPLECIIIDSESSSDSDCKITKAPHQKRETFKKEHMPNNSNETLIKDMIVTQYNVSEVLQEKNTSIPADENNELNKYKTDIEDCGGNMFNDFISEDDPEFVWVENAESIAEPRETVQVSSVNESLSGGISASTGVDYENTDKEQEIVILTDASQDDDVQNENIVEICMTEEMDNSVENLITIVEGSDQDIKSIEPGSSNIVLIEVKENEELIITHGINIDSSEEIGLTETMPISNFEAEMKICEGHLVNNEGFEKNIETENNEIEEVKIKNDDLIFDNSNENVPFQPDDGISKTKKCKKVIDKANDSVILNESEIATCKDNRVTLDKIECKNIIDTVKECLEEVVQQISKCSDVSKNKEIPTNDVICVDDISCRKEEDAASLFKTIDLTLSEVPEDEKDAKLVKITSKETLDHFPSKPEHHEYSNRSCELTLQSNVECSGDKICGNTYGPNDESDDSMDVILKKSCNDCDSKKNCSLNMMDGKLNCFNEPTAYDQRKENDEEPNKQMVNTQRNDSSALTPERDVGNKKSLMTNLDSEQILLNETLESENTAENTEKIENKLSFLPRNTPLANFKTADTEMNNRNGTYTKCMRMKNSNEESNTEPSFETEGMVENENLAKLALLNETNKYEYNLLDKEELNSIKQGNDLAEGVVPVVNISSCEQKNIFEPKVELFSVISREASFKSDQEVQDASLVEPMKFKNKVDDNKGQIVTDSDLDICDEGSRRSSEFSKLEVVSGSDRILQQNETVEASSPWTKQGTAIINDTREIVNNLDEMADTSSKGSEICKSFIYEGEVDNSTNQIEYVSTNVHQNLSSEGEKVQDDGAREDVKQDVCSKVQSECAVKVSKDIPELTLDEISVNQELGLDTCDILVGKSPLDLKQIKADAGEVNVTQMKTDYNDLEDEKEDLIEKSVIQVSPEQVLSDAGEGFLLSKDSLKTDEILIPPIHSNKIGLCLSPYSRPSENCIQESLYEQMNAEVIKEMDLNTCKDKHEVKHIKTHTLVHENINFLGFPLNVTKDKQLQAECGEEILIAESEVVVKDYIAVEEEINEETAVNTIEVSNEISDDVAEVKTAGLAHNHVLQIAADTLNEEASEQEKISNVSECKAEESEKSESLSCSADRIEQNKGSQNDQRSVLIDEEHKSCGRDNTQYSLPQVCPEILTGDFSEEMSELRATNGEENKLEFEIEPKTNSMNDNKTSLESSNLHETNESALKDGASVTEIDVSSCNGINERNNDCIDYDHQFESSENSCNNQNEFSDTHFEPSLIDETSYHRENKNIKPSLTTSPYGTVTQNVPEKEDGNCLAVSDIETNLHGDDANQKNVQQIQHIQNLTGFKTEVLQQTSDLCIEDVVRALLEILVESVTGTEKGTAYNAKENVSEVQEKDPAINEITMEVPEISIQSQSIHSVSHSSKNQEGIMTDACFDLLESSQHDLKSVENIDTNEPVGKVYNKNTTETSCWENPTSVNDNFKEGCNDSIHKDGNRTQQIDASKGKQEAVLDGLEIEEHQGTNDKFKEEISTNVPALVKCESIDSVPEFNASNSESDNDSIVNKCAEFEIDINKKYDTKLNIIGKAKEFVVRNHLRRSHAALGSDSPLIPELPTSKIDNMLKDVKMETTEEKPSLQSHPFSKTSKETNEVDGFSECPDNSMQSSSIEGKVNVKTDHLDQNFEASTIERKTEIKKRNEVKRCAKKSKIEKGKNENLSRNTKSESSGKELRNSAHRKNAMDAVGKQQDIESKRQCVPGKRIVVTENVHCEILKQKPEITSEPEKDAPEDTAKPETVAKLEDSSINKCIQEEEGSDEEEQFKRRMESMKKARRKSATVPYESDFNFDGTTNECDPQLNERLAKRGPSNKDSPVKSGGVEQFLQRMESVKKARRKTASAPYQSDFNFSCENVQGEKRDLELCDSLTTDYVTKVTENVKSQINTRSRQSKSAPTVPAKSAVTPDVKTYTKDSKVDIFSPHIFTLDSVKRLRDQATKKQTSSTSSKLPSSSKISYINELKQTKAELNSYRQLGNNSKRKCAESSKFAQVKSSKLKPTLVETKEGDPPISSHSEELSPQGNIKSSSIQKKDRPKRSHNDSGIESDKDEMLSVAKQSEIKTRNKCDAVSKCGKDIKHHKTGEKVCSNKLKDSVEKSLCSNKRKRTNTNVNEICESQPTSKAFKPDGTSKSPDKPECKQSLEQSRHGKCDTKCDKCVENRSRTTSPKPRYDNKKHVRQIIHGGKIFEIKKGSLTEREFKRSDSKKDVTVNEPSSSNNERSDRSRLKRDSKYFTRMRDSEPSQTIEMTVIEERTNLNDYIHKTLKEIKKERKCVSLKTSNWTVKKERHVKSNSKFPYAFKKSPRR